MKKNLLPSAFFVIIILLFTACGDNHDDVLAPYNGSRALIFLRVTKSMTPDIQWLGGRVAAVGVNKGKKAALDQTLIYLRTADANTIASWVSYGEQSNDALILQYGGTPSKTLADSTEYTFWLAEKNAFDASLDSSLCTDFNFMDTTFVMSNKLVGKVGGEKNAQGKELLNMTIIRNESMLDDVYTLYWTPENIAFRQIAVRINSLGGFKDLIWHVVTPDSLPDNIFPPVTIGTAPAGTEEAVPWPATAFEKNKVQILWMSNSKWTVNNFSPSAAGYAWFRIYPFE